MAFGRGATLYQIGTRPVGEEHFMSNTTRYGIIGAGMMAQEHIQTSICWMTPPSQRFVTRFAAP